MKSLRSTICLAILVFGTWCEASDKDPDVPKASDGWPMVLLSEPFHIGDQVQNEMKQPKPMGKEIKKKFILDAGVRSLYVGVWLTSTVGPEHKEFKKGHYQIKLLMNGKEIGVLNKKLSRRRKPGEPQKVLIQVDSQDLLKEVNELVIQCGAKGENISECEIHKIILSLTKP